LLSDVKHHQTNKQTYSGREQLQQYHKTIENSGRNETTTQQLLTATETTTQFWQPQEKYGELRGVEEKSFVRVTMWLIFSWYLQIRRGRRSHDRMVVGVYRPYSTIFQLWWWSVLLFGRTRWPGENHRPVASNWQTLSHNVVHLTLIEIRTLNISGDRHRLHR
jgi:hypothetical protein